jgi:site-specific DNA-cytosine methylase
MLQGFPSDINMNNIPRSQLYKQAGNSMSVNVLSFLFNEIFKSII